MQGMKKLASLAIAIVILVLAAVLNMAGLLPADGNSGGEDARTAAVEAEVGEGGDGSADSQSARADGAAASGTATSPAKTTSGSTLRADDSATTASGAAVSTQKDADPDAIAVVEDGSYIHKDEVAAYIHEFGHLPPNFISKTKARAAGWVASEGNLDEVLPGMSIGGSVFYDDEGNLPDATGRRWTECDINYTGGFRGSERIVFSNDGLIFYTADHYQTYEQLY